MKKKKTSLKVRVHPTKFGVVAFLSGGALALLTVAVHTGFWTYWLAFLFLAIFLMGADFIFRPRMEGINVTLAAPPQLFVNSKHSAGIRIENPLQRAIQIRLKIDVSHFLDEIPECTAVAPESGETEIKFPLLSKRRGVVEIEGLWLRAHGPLHLLAFQRKVPLKKTLVVNPNLPAVSQDAVRHFTSKSYVQGTRVERYRGDGTEFDSMREYEPGFDIRTIDWKSSARHAKLLCKELRAERNRQVVMAIDTGRLMSEPLQGIPRLDHAIHCGLTLASVSLHVGDWVSLISFDENVHHYCPPVRGRGAVRKLTQIASRIEYSSNETNFTLAMMELARRQTRRALVVVFTDFVDTITAELMVENLSRVAARHLVLFVAIQDPLLRVDASNPPLRMIALQRAVVSHSLLQEREMVIHKLRRRGIHCIDTLSNQVSSQLIDRYLELKRKEAF